jgi:hypothetical protein
MDGTNVSLIYFLMAIIKKTIGRILSQVIASVAENGNISTSNDGATDCTDSFVLAPPMPSHKR